MPAVQLNIRRNQLTYVGLFTNPMMDWLGNFAEPSKALLQAFGPLGYGLDSLQVTAAAQSANQQSAQVFFGAQGNYLCKLDRCEANFFDLNFQAQLNAGKALEAADAALRATSPKWKIRSHQFTYVGHGQLEAISVGKVLGQFHVQAPKRGGISTGMGVIFHWQVPEKGWQTQLILDASLLVTGGLFFSLSLTMEKDPTDLTDVLKAGRTYLIDLFDEIGIILPAEGDA